MTVILLLAVVALLAGWSPGLTLVAVALAGLLLDRWGAGWSSFSRR